MKLALLLFVPAIALPQPILQHGADVFATTCATGYCHGADGSGGGAPKLASRGFDEAYIISTVRAGVQGTAMKGYGTVLARPEFNAVVAYVAKLNGIEPRVIETPSKPLSAEADRGRELFFDPLRGFARCSTCHQVNGLGIAVAPIASIPKSLREIAAPHVKVASIDGDRFPALILSSGGRRTSLWDLTSLPPVLRTVDSASLKVADAAWNHAASFGSYTDADLTAILTFLIQSAR